MSSEPKHTCSPIRAKNVVVVGSANTDVTSYAPRMPLPGETLIGNEFTTSCGGKGANQAVAAALLDIPGVDVSMICKVGRDQFGDLLLKNFERAGVLYDEASVFADDGVTTGVATILVDDRSGENCIVVVPGANGELSPVDVEQGFESLMQRNKVPDVVLCQLEINLSSALKALHCAKKLNSNCITILNPAPAPTENMEFEQLSKEFYALTDIIVPNETELQLLCNDDGSDEVFLAQKLLAKGVNKAVIVTLGARGSVIVEKSGTVTQVAIPALPCSSLPVKDTVGAGDAFCGALASYLSAGIDLVEAARRSCGIASMSVRKQGAQSSYPIFEDLPQELQLPGPKVEKIAKIPPITFVTGNKKKLEEVQRMLVTSGKIPFSITNRKIDLPELQGDPSDIAVEKCKLAVAEVNGPVMTEDTSLCFNALNGLPGPYIKWFLEKTGHSGLNSMLSGTDDKTAYAQTIVAFSAGPGCEVHLFDGRTNGNIVPARGPLDFGWDPVFEPHESNGLTYAEMTKDAKNLISHRGRSFAKLQAFLIENKDSIVKDMGP